MIWNLIGWFSWNCIAEYFAYCNKRQFICILHQQILYIVDCYYWRLFYFHFSFWSLLLQSIDISFTCNIKKISKIHNSIWCLWNFAKVVFGHCSIHSSFYWVKSFFEIQNILELCVRIEINKRKLEIWNWKLIFLVCFILAQWQLPIWPLSFPIGSEIALIFDK